MEYHVLKKAKVDYLDWVAELNDWANSYIKVKRVRPHKEVCMELFGWSESEFDRRVNALCSPEGSSYI